MLLTAVAVAYLPGLILAMFGYGPPLGPLAKGIMIPLYLVVAAAALSRWANYRMRLSASFIAAYLSLVFFSLVSPRGPYAQAGLVTMPIFVLVLLGASSARVPRGKPVEPDAARPGTPEARSRARSRG